MSETNVCEVSGAMLVERVESEDGILVAVGREIGKSDEKAVLAAWKDLCGARRKWSLAYKEEVGRTHEADELIASEAHKEMVGPYQKIYGEMVGAQMKRTLSSDCKAGVGDILYN